MTGPKEKLRIVFMGTPDFAVPALKALIGTGHDVVGVFTQPPRPKGRGQKMQPSPIHLAAQAHNIPVYTPRSLKKDTDAVTAFLALEPDLAVVAAYGLLLPPRVLEGPKFGCLNIHASLLPRWRGASPIQHAIWKGDTETGITIMRMEEGLDTGPMLLKRAVAIRPQTTAQSLHDELSALGAGMIAEIVARLAQERALPEAEKQDDSKATYAPLLKKEDGKIDWAQTAAEIDRQIRALNPWPGVYTQTQNGRRLKILSAEVLNETLIRPPGTLTGRSGHVACGGDTALRLVLIQPDSGKPMDIAAAISGRYISEDEVFC